MPTIFLTNVAPKDVADTHYANTSTAHGINNKADLVGGKVPASQLPAFVDDVLEFANLAAFPVTGETDKIYVAIDTNLTYRWSGSAYVEISQSLALGETSSTAYRGDRGKTAYDHSQELGTPHVTDIEKNTWNAKQDALVSGTNIKTVNGVILLGSGDLVVSGGLTVITKNADYTAVSGDLVVYDTNGSSRTLTLPASGRVGIYLKTVTGFLTVTITGQDVLYVAGDYVEYVHDGSAWIRVVDKRRAHLGKLTRTTSQTINTITTTKVLHATSVINIGGMVDTTNNRITIRRAGNYAVFAFWAINQNQVVNDFAFYTYIYKNGAEATSRSIFNTRVAGNNSSEGDCTLVLAATDYIEHYVYHNLGVNNPIGDNTDRIPFLTVQEIL